jgi:hypothetical protein
VVGGLFDEIVLEELPWEAAVQDDNKAVDDGSFDEEGPAAPKLTVLADSDSPSSEG